MVVWARRSGPAGVVGGDRETERGVREVRGRENEGADQMDRSEENERGTLAVPGGPNRMALYCGGPTGIVAAVSAGTAGAAGARRGDCGNTLAGRSSG